MKSTKLMWSGAFVLVVLLLASYIVPGFYFKGYASSKAGDLNGSYGNGNNKSNRWSSNQYGYGMMGQNWGSAINPNENKNIEDSLKNAIIDKGKNSVTYSGDNIKIVVLGGPKQADEKFIIGGLINPTIYISKNSEVTLEFINEDEDMYHNVAIINAAPPMPI